MTKKILLATFLLIAAFGCKKEQNRTPGSGLTGTWELRQSAGGFTGTVTKYPAGNGRLLKLNSDSTYEQFTSFKSVAKGFFNVVKNGITLGNDKFDAIYFNGNPVQETLRLNADTLRIGLDYDDGVEAMYIRQH